ncbi:MAG TPA: response regulator [Myxococcota bacterium]
MRADGERPARREPGAERTRVPHPVDEPVEPGPRYDRERLVVVAHADPETGKQVADALESWGLETLVAHDGVEAMLAIQRALPRAVVLDAALPRMYGFQVCEIVKRNESLRSIQVVLVGAIHREERYRRQPRDLYGADVYVEPPDLPDALLEILTRFGLPVRSEASVEPRRGAAPYGHVARGGSPPLRERTEPLLDREPRGGARSEATRGAEPAAARAPRPRVPDAVPSPAPGERRPPTPMRDDEGRRAASAARAATPSAVRPAAGAGAEAGAADADPLAAERAKAERLARIIVSDIVLYNPEKFDAAVRAGGDVVAAMHDELEEGRALFRDRIDARVRAERDYLAEELNRAAKARSGR